MKNIIIATVILLFFENTAYAQKTITIQKLANLPVLDGDITDTIWNSLEEVGAFNMAYPQFGKPSQSATTIKMGYSDAGIYIAAQCTSANVRNDGSNRDEKGTGDYLSVGLDTWNDDQYAFVFTVSASGQRTEERTSSNQSESGFDTPWLAHTAIQADGWTAEIFIPFRSVRYQREGIQNWGIQFTRYDRSTGETSTWSPQSPLIQDVVLQYGNLEGLIIPKQKERFGVTNQSNYKMDWYKQYLVVSDSTYYTYNIKGIGRAEARLDGRWGPSPNTTIDLSLMPALVWNNYKDYDFPLAQKALVRNKNPQLTDHRPLETEENSLFNKTTPLRFINGIPFGYFKIFSEIPEPAGLSNTEGGQLLNHIKVAARPSKNISVGVSNAIYSQMSESYYNLTTGEAGGFLTNKFPVVNQVSIERIFSNNSWVQVSNLHEFLNSPYGFNIASAAGQWRDKSNHYELSGKIDMETVQTTDNFSRLRGNAAIRKINGAWVWSAGYTSHGQRYNPDFSSSDPLEQLHILQGNIGKRNFNPSNTYWLNTTKGIYSTLYIDNQTQKPESHLVGIYWSGLNKQFNRVEVSAGFLSLKRDEFLFLPNSDIARNIPPSVLFTGKWASDERKRIWMEVGGNIDKNLLEAEDNWNTYGQIRYVPHPKWRFQATWNYDLETNHQNALDDFSQVYGVEKSDWHTILVNTDVWFMPIPKLAVGAGISHNIFRISDRQAFLLLPDGSLQPTEYNFTVNQNIENTLPEFFFTWYMSPLRQIKISWQNNRTITHNLNLSTPLIFSFHNNVSTLNISAIFSLYN